VNSQLAELLLPNERKALERFLIRLQTRYPGRIFQAILFGSKARGASQSESDIDILLVTDADDWRFRHALSDIASDVSLEYDVLISPRIIERERWDQMAREGFSLYQNVTREGLLLTSESI
jgi:predicted nucleotidyltransferase